MYLKSNYVNLIVLNQAFLKENSMAKKKSKSVKSAKTTKKTKVVKAVNKPGELEEELGMSLFDCGDDFCDFDHFDDVVDDEIALDFFDQFSHVVEAQSNTAVDLTKMIVDHHEKGHYSETDILSLYRRAVEVVFDSSPLKAMMDEYLAK